MPKFSQNFLINQSVLPEIIQAADLNSNDLILEIGPGHGILTKQLCRVAHEIIAIEIDRELIPGLREIQAILPNLKIYNADFNEFNYQEIIGNRPYKIVANIPYHITGLIIRNIFNHKFYLPSRVVLMVQYEVAKKMFPKEQDQTVLSNILRAFGTVSIVAKVDKKSFKPVPKVDSAIVLIDQIKPPQIKNFDKFISLIKIGFSARRKTLCNNLAHGLDIPKPEIAKILSGLGIAPNSRAQTLSLAQWKKLYLKLNYK